MTTGADPETRRIRLRLAAADGLTSVTLSPQDGRICLDGCTVLALREAAVSGDDHL